MQESIKFGVVLSSPLAKMPSKNNKTDAGFDLSSIEELFIDPGQRVIVDTGVILKLTTGWEAQIRPRSGLAAKSGITVVNTPGTVDAEYRGNIKVILLNTGNVPFKISVGDRIAQMVIKEVPLVELEQHTSVDETGRGSNGFGSSGVK